jgi:V8-like Glu-specific endopeptidase
MEKLVLLVVAALAASLIGGAEAITYGQPDGNLHPNVGAMIRLRPSDNQLRIVCSGSLISPTVFLTASHCTSFVESTGQTDIWVTFDSSFTSKSKLLHGTMHTNPLYNQSQSDPEDIAVITLDKPVTNIAPVQLPPAGLLDALKANGTLKDQLFTSVGYGIQEPMPGPGGITHAFPMER